MRVALHDFDDTKFPNLALMKLSALHKSKGDDVEIYMPIMSSSYDQVYASKVFTSSERELLIGDNVSYGGSGFADSSDLPDEIEHICPDYDLYGMDYSLGFLTRGCPRKCKWCIVPSKEGGIRGHADIEEFLRHKRVVLMDNNVLASQHGVQQIEKMARLGVRVDFNQGLDARLIDDKMSVILSNLKWDPYLRLACDSVAAKGAVQKAVTLLRWNNCTPRRYFVYCLLTDDIDESMERVMFLKGLYLDVFAQPYMDAKGSKPGRVQRELARWVNHKGLFNSVKWKDYRNGKGF